MAMSSTLRQAERVDHCESCGALIRWAFTAATGSAIPLNPTAVPAGTRGALVLIGEKAFGYAQAVVHLASSFDVSEADAAVIVSIDYTWHLAHFATCPNANEHRKGRR